MIAADELQSLMETEYLLKAPANAAHLARSLAEYRQSKASPRDLMAAGEREPT